MPTLADLDRAFDDLWMHTEQLPALLSQWQEMVNAALKTEDVDAAYLSEFEQYMNRWETVLSENRNLLEGHQETLKAQLKEGDSKVSSDDIKKKFQ